MSIVSGCQRVVFTKCDWCGRRPSVEYITSTGRIAHVCKECSETCVLCQKNPSVVHYTDNIDAEIFLCENCYKNLDKKLKKKCKPVLN